MNAQATPIKKSAKSTSPARKPERYVRDLDFN